MRIFSEEHRRRLSESAKGKKRKPFTDETRNKMSETKKSKHYKSNQKQLDSLKLGRRSNEENSMWKGDKASSLAFHVWLRKNKPKPLLCEECNKERKLDLANTKNHVYTRNPKDYKYLCRSCHSKLDNKYLSFKKGGE